MDRKRVVVFGVAGVSAMTLAVAAASVTASRASQGGPVTLDFETGLLGEILGVVQIGSGGGVTGVLDLIWFVPGLIVVCIVCYGIVANVGIKEIAAIVPLSLIGLVMFLTFPLTEVPDALAESEGSSDGNPFEALEMVVEGGEQLTVHLTPIVGMVLLLLGMVAAVMILTDGWDKEDPEVKPFETSGPTEIESLREAAGRAADQLEESRSFENAIYGAWWEMTASLSVEDPETTTPREFEARAIEAGLSAGDVRELTGLFETVRYGRLPVTDERRERAREVLRNIESTTQGGADA